MTRLTETSKSSNIGENTYVQDNAGRSGSDVSVASRMYTATSERIVDKQPPLGFRNESGAEIFGAKNSSKDYKSMGRRRLTAADASPETTGRTRTATTVSSLVHPMPSTHETFGGDTIFPKQYRNAKESTARNRTAVNVRSRGPKFGLAHWQQFLRSSKDLPQPFRKNISWQEIQQHSDSVASRNDHDYWIVLKGTVYNIGPYLPYHPGGMEIFSNAKVLGADGTCIFDKYHPWVNIDALIGKLAIGTVATHSLEDVSNGDHGDGNNKVDEK